MASGRIRGWLTGDFACLLYPALFKLGLHFVANDGYG
jgi:hypothetical protein